MDLKEILIGHVVEYMSDFLTPPHPTLKKGQLLKITKYLVDGYEAIDAQNNQYVVLDDWISRVDISKEQFFYVQQGWIPGARFRVGSSKIKRVHHLELSGAKVNGVKYSNEVLVIEEDSGTAYDIAMCQLYRADYPKSVDDIPGYNMSMWGSPAYKYVDQHMLAMIELSHLHKAIIEQYSEDSNLSSVWEADYTNYDQYKYAVGRHTNVLTVYEFTTYYSEFCFPTREAAEFSLKHHEQLWKKYYNLP